MNLNPSAEPQANARKTNSRALTWAVILVWLTLFVLLIWFRMEIRARWWVYQLRHTEDPVARQYYATSLIAIGAKGVEPVGQIIHFDDPPEVHLLAVRILQECPGEEAGKWLTLFVLSGDQNVAETAALALGRRSDSANSLPILESMIQDQPPTAVCAIALALERIPSPKARAMLRDLVRTASDPDVVAQAMDSLALSGDVEAVPLLTDRLTDDRPLSAPPFSQRQAQRAAAMVQGQGGLKGVDPRALLEAVPDDRTVAAVAGRGLGLLTGQGLGNPASRPEVTETNRQP